jgi:hypothetical protein
LGVFYNPAREYMKNGKSYVTAGRAAGSTLDANATAEGINNTASGEAAHAEGKNNTASGNYSHAQGINTLASGQASTALGTNTAAKATNQVVLGTYNADDANAIVIIGGGTAANPRNLLRVDAQTGNVTNLSGQSLIAAPPTNNGTYVYQFSNGVGSWVSLADAGIGV